jgi:site-specific DNA recombinase
MKGSSNPKAVIYARVSSAKQKTDGHGLESQETRCREYAGYRGYEVINVFRDDISGAKGSRPGMRDLLSFLKKHRRDPHIVLIDDISRLARSVRAHMDLRAAITVAGGILESPTLEFGDDADSELQEYILATVSQHQRRKNAEQVKNRMRARTLGGYWTFQAPAGYRYEKVAGHGKLLVPDEPYASIVREALEGYASGRFQTQVEVQRFVLSHVEWASSTNSAMSSQNVYDLLTRPIYAGYLSMPDWGINLQPGKHQALITLETHNLILERLAGKAKVPARKDIKEDFPLRGFVVCANCDTPYQGCWSKGRHRHYAYYLCYKKGCPDYGKSIKRDVVEDAFASLLTDLRPTSDLFAFARDIFADIWDQRMGSAKTRAQSVKAELKKCESDIAALLDRVIEANSTTLIKAYEDRIQALELRKLELSENLARSGKPVQDFQTSFRTAIAFLANPHKLWVSERIDYRRIVLKLAFADRLRYARGEGFRTPEISLPFKLLGRLKVGEKGMVDATGIEPVTPSMSTKCSPAELRIRRKARGLSSPGGKARSITRAPRRLQA